MNIESIETNPVYRLYIRQPIRVSEGFMKVSLNFQSVVLTNVISLPASQQQTVEYLVESFS